MFWRARTTPGRAICLADQFPKIKLPEVMAGRVTFVGLPPVDLGQNIDWRLNPHGNRSWALNLHTLRWMGRLVAEYERSGERAYLDRAETLADDWIHKNPRDHADISPWAWAEHAVALRAPVLVCLSAHVDSRPLLDSLAEHGEILSDPTLYRQGHNHGLDQDIALLVVGCRLGRKGWRDLAIRRMLASAELAIDEQGVLHEQAPRYGLYVHRRLGWQYGRSRRAGPRSRTGWRRAGPPSKRTLPMPRSPTASSRPSGTARRTCGRTGSRTTGRRCASSTAGTSSAGPRGTTWSRRSTRSGSGRGGGCTGTRTIWASPITRRVVRCWSRPVSIPTRRRTTWSGPSPTRAHDVPSVVGAGFRAGTATCLEASDIGPSRQSYRLSDQAYGVRRTREVLVSHGADLMAVLDSVPEGHTVRDLWHFDPSLRLIGRRDGVVVLGDETRRVTLLQLTADGRPVGGQTVRRGTVSPGYLRTAETVTVTSPEASRLLTVIVPGSADPAVSVEGDLITVRTPGGPVTFRGDPTVPL